MNNNIKSANDYYLMIITVMSVTDNIILILDSRH